MVDMGLVPSVKYKAKDKMKIIRRIIKEDAPTNNVGSGNIAGMGVGAQGEPPGVQSSKYVKNNKRDTKTIFSNVQRRLSKPIMEVKRGKFAGNDTFIVPTHVYHSAVHHKAKGAHWTKYLKEDEYGMAIREFANRNPHKPIIIEDEKTGYLTYARYGRKK